MKVWTLLAAFLIAITISVTSSVHAGSALVGNDLVQLMREFDKPDTDETRNPFEIGTYEGYVTGVTDATVSMYSFDSTVTVRQICTVVARYLKQHPERWNEPASDLVISALKEAYPKKP